MRISLFLAWVGLVTRSTEGRTHRHTETIRISPHDSRNLQQRTAHYRVGTNGHQAGGATMTSSHLRHPVANSADEESDGEVDYDAPAHTYNSGGKGKSHKKGGYGYNYDDLYYGDDEYTVDDYYGDDYYDDDHYYEEADDDWHGSKGSKGAGAKGTKSSSGKGKGGEKGSKKSSKKAKSSKKKIDKKLKAKSDDYDDDWMNDDHYMDDYYGDDDWWSWYTDAPTPVDGGPTDGSQAPTVEGASQAPTVEGASQAPTVEGASQAPTLAVAVPSRTGLGRSRATSAPTVSPGNPLFTSRMRAGDSSFVVQAQASAVQGSDSDAQDTSRAQPAQIIGVPKVQRELFPDAIQLKAHSPVHLQEHDPEFFAETTNFLTPCLQRTYTKHLQAYKMTVEYSDGPDATAAGVIVTHMTIKVVISVMTDTIDALKLITHDAASKTLHSCFDGPQMYDFLGSLRREGVQINEIAFLDTPFRSPVFGDNEPVAIVSNGEKSSPMEEPKDSKAGLIATLSVGMIVVGAVLLAQHKGALPAVQIPTDRLGHLGDSIRNTATAGKKQIGRVSKAIRGKFNQTSFGSDDAVAGEIDEGGSVSGKRVRTWSGSFRRHPEGGIRPAALQKEPAFSKDFMKDPRSPGNDNNSFSVVGDDYNVPDEYDFQATPVSEMYSGRVSSKQSPQRPASIGDETEFSMPDDYNTVNEDMSIYSRSASVMAGLRGSRNGDARLGRLPGNARPTSRGRPNPFVSPTRSTPSSASDAQSPKDGYLDEWSMNSFTTSSPVAATTESSEASPPYRHWDSGKPRDSPGSKLAMPRLS